MKMYVVNHNSRSPRGMSLLLIAAAFLVSGIAVLRPRQSEVLHSPAGPVRSESQNAVAYRPEQASGPAESVLVNGPLRVNPANPRYFMDGNGDTVYLTGSSFWDVLQDSGTTTELPFLLDYPGWLNFLQSYNHNFFRLYMWEQAKGVAETTTPYYW